MSNNVIYEPSENKKIFSRIYGVVFFILIVLLLTVIFTLIRTDLVTNSVLKRENIPFLLIISDDEKPILTEAILFNAKTKRLALIDIPQEAGDLLPDLKRSDRFSVFYQSGNYRKYQESIEKLLKLEFLFTLNLHVANQVKLVDLLEGLKLYFFAPIYRINPETQKRYIYQAGEQILDGDQARDFLYAGDRTIEYQEYLVKKSVLGGSSKDTQDVDFNKRHTLRQKNMRFVRELILGIVATLQEYREEQKDYIDLIYYYFQTDLSKRSFRKLLQYLSEIDVPSAEVIFQDYLGKERLVQGQRINFPVYDGQIMRSQVVRISSQLQSQEEIEAEEYPVRVEILNGTNTYRLASKTVSLYSGGGFDVVNVNNADRSDYEKTVVINLHSNSLEDVRKVANVIGADNVILQPLPGGEQTQAEVRVVLGRDFDGTQVAE